MIRCPYCDSYHAASEPVSDGASFVKKCDYCGKAFKVDVWIDFDTYEMERPVVVGGSASGELMDRISEDQR